MAALSAGSKNRSLDKPPVMSKQSSLECVQESKKSISNVILDVPSKSVKSDLSSAVDYIMLMQHKIRKKQSNYLRVDRKNLIERLRFEDTSLSGALQMFNLVIILGLMMIGISLSDDIEAKRSIRHTLHGGLGLQKVLEATNKMEVWQALTEVEKASSMFFPSSTTVYQSPLATTLLVGPFETFPTQKPLSSTLSLNVDVQEFSLQAWVAVQPTFIGGGNMIRKRAGNDATSSALSCWKWSLGSKTEQTFSFNAHSFYHTSTDIDKEISTSMQMGERLPAENIISATSNSSMIPGKLYLLTMSVTKTNVTFYQDQEMVASLPLLHPVTDCHNPSGVMVGDKATMIGQLRYYPVPLNLVSIQEVYIHGALLKSIASAETPNEIGLSETEYITSSMMEMQRASDGRVEESDNEQELTSVAQVAELLTFTPDDEQAATPKASFGKQTPVSFTSTTDAATPDTPYRSLVYEPIHFVPGKATDEPYYFDREAFPTFNASGVTMTMWYQLDMQAPYILVGAPDDVTSGMQCWGVWMYNDGSGIFAQDPYIWINFRDTLSPENQLMPGVWRHIAFQFDALNDQIRFYVDGVVLYEEQLEVGFVAAMDKNCAGPTGRVTVATASPGWYFAGNFEMADLRVIVEDTPTPPEVIYAMANTPEVTSVTRACFPFELLTDDPLWSDVFGHNCEWYAEKSMINPKICKTPGASERCRLGCKVTPCFVGPNPTPPVRYLWDRIHRVQPISEQGSLCLNSDEDVDHVREMCERGVVSESYLSALQRMKQRVAIPQINMTDCEQLVAAIDDTCTINATTVRLFTDDVLANGGDYSILFWVRNTDESSLDNSGLFIPHINFYESLAPVDLSHTLQASHQGLGADFPFYEVFSTCGDTGHKEIRSYNKGPLPQDQWTLVSMVRTNTTSPAKASIGFDYVPFSEPGIGNSEFPYCMHNRSNPIISALDFNYEMLISPIVLIPWAMQLSDLQKYYYFHKGDMAIRNGPLVSERGRSNQVFNVDKNSYLPTVASVSPPILFTTRTDMPPACNYDFSTKWLEVNHKAAVSTHCDNKTRLCDAQVEGDPATFLICGTGQPQTKGQFFGLPVSEFLGEHGFADFLYSFTRHSFLTREGVERDTSSIIDTNTLSARAVFVFYTPGSGTTTVLQVRANFIGEKVMHANIKVDHFSILEGDELLTYAAVQLITLIYVAVLFINGVKELLKMRRNYVYLGMEYRLDYMCMMLIDIAVAVFLSIFQINRLRYKIDSASNTDKTVGMITSIPWADSSLSPGEKTVTFLDSVQDLLQLMSDAESSNQILTYTLVFLIGRILVATSCHPRLALLTGTIARSLDDLWHTAMLVVTTMCFFASIGVWLFGEERDEFANFEKAMQTLFEMMIVNELPVNWGSSTDLVLYSVLYSLVIGMIVLNFLLAIVVDSYMKVRDFNIDFETELEFVTDFFCCAVGRILSYYHKWPSKVVVAAEIEKCIKKNIGLDELRSIQKFGSISEATSFLRHYSRYSALQPKPIEAPEYLPMADEVERRVAMMLGTAPSTRSARRAYNATTSEVNKVNGIDNTLKKHTEMLEMLARSHAVIAERLGMVDFSDFKPLNSEETLNRGNDANVSTCMSSATVMNTDMCDELGVPGDHGSIHGLNPHEIYASL